MRVAGDCVVDWYNIKISLFFIQRLEEKKGWGGMRKEVEWGCVSPRMCCLLVLLVIVLRRIEIIVKRT